MINIVLHEPEIPANTGNIGRTCCAAGVKLHLIEPLGFKLDEKSVKRAGLDYWDKLDYTIYDSYPDFLEKNPGAKIYMATTKAKQQATDASRIKDSFRVLHLAGSMPRRARPAAQSPSSCLQTK